MKFVRESYYEILKVSPEATNEEVKRAYRVVRRSYRSDSMAVHSLYSAEETEAIASKIDEAFRLLSSPESARRYSKYHRAGRPGTSIPRDPDAFFDQVHELDGPSPIEELARHVGARKAAPAAPAPAPAPAPRAERTPPVEVRRRPPRPEETALRLTTSAPKVPAVSPALLDPPAAEAAPDPRTPSTRQRAPLAPRPTTLSAIPAVQTTTRDELPPVADPSLDDTALDEVPTERNHAPRTGDVPPTRPAAAAPVATPRPPVAAPKAPPAVAAPTASTAPAKAANEPVAAKPTKAPKAGRRLGRNTAALLQDVAVPDPPAAPKKGRLGRRTSSLLEDAVASMRDDEPTAHDPVEALLGVPTPPPAPKKPRQVEAKVEMLLDQLEEVDDTEFDDVDPGLASLVPEPRAVVESLPSNTPAPDWGADLPASTAATVANGQALPALRSATKAPAAPAVGLLQPLDGWDLGPAEEPAPPPKTFRPVTPPPPAIRPAAAPPPPPAATPAFRPAPPQPMRREEPRRAEPPRRPTRPATAVAPPADPFAPVTFRPAPMPAARPAAQTTWTPQPPSTPAPQPLRPAAHATPMDPSTRPLPGSRVGPEHQSSTTLAQVAAVAQPEGRSRRWMRETVRTRAVGALDVQPLPAAELEALQMDCGGVNGEYLRQVRRQLNISLEDIASRTKIGLSWLRAIEADDLEELPARVYLKGYLSQMCRLLRLPVPQTPERYLAHHRIR